MVFRFLHLSDIHFGQEKNGTRVTHAHVRDALINDVRELSKKRGSATRVLVTGDIAYSGKLAEYHTAAEWLEELTQACQCDAAHVSTIPGNHDCDLSAITNQAKMTYAHMRVSSSDQIQADLSGIVQDGEPSSPFLPKLKAYRDFANGFGCDFESPTRPLWVRDFELPSGVKLRFHGLTSVQVSDLSDSVGKMVLGNEQYTIAEKQNVINIILCHHPLDWFIDEKEACQFLQNNARVIMVGHEHSPNVQKTTDAYSKKEWLVLSAGAVSPPEKGYDYSYNWLEFSCVEEGGSHALVVEVFPRIWMQQTVRFDADRALLGGSNESIQVRIQCSNLSSLANQIAGCTVRHTHVPPTLVPEAIADPTTLAVSIEQPCPSPQDGLSMNTQSAGFERLRYFFWRYLDWRQRLKVLVDVDALPHTADQPVPQTLERKALDAAAKDPAALHALWEAVMPLVPEEKRQTNPFPLQS